MLLIDALDEVSDDTATCSVTPRADNLFAQGDHIPALITIEYMAQTVGAFAGLRHHAQGHTPRPG
jgi:predicted hotdog family 3-hydroxylacyl-ACP dehydratase